MDHRAKGVISKEELVHTAKMMDCTLTAPDIDALKEILPEGTINKDDQVDYRELNYFIQHHTPRDDLFGAQQAAAVAAESSFGLGSPLYHRQPRKLRIHGGDPLTHSLTHSLTHTFTHTFTHSLTHLFIHSLTRSPTYPLIHSLTHSLHRPARTPIRAAQLRGAAFLRFAWPSDSWFLVAW